MEFSFDSLASACAFACSAAETRDSAAMVSVFAASRAALVSLTAFTASCSRCCASASFAARPVRMSRFDCASSRSVWEPVSLSAATPVSAFAASTARWASARALAVPSAFCLASARTVDFSACSAAAASWTLFAVSSAFLASATSWKNFARSAFASVHALLLGLRCPPWRSPAWTVRSLRLRWRHQKQPASAGRSTLPYRRLRWRHRGPISPHQARSGHP